jgi:hypothetical protein
MVNLFFSATPGDGRSSSRSYRGAPSAALTATQGAIGEIRPNLHNKIAALPTTLCHLEQFLLLLGGGGAQRQLGCSLWQVGCSL